MNVSFSGTRPPVNGFGLFELDAILGQLDDLPPGTRIAQGGCIGVDAIIGKAAWERGFYVVTFLPGKAWRKYTAPDYREWSHFTYDTGKDQASRNVDIVDFGEKVRGIPLHESDRQRRSGTWKAIRLAYRAGKLERVLTLRPRSSDMPKLDIYESASAASS